MTCTRATEFLELTLGDTVDPLEVGATDSAMVRTHVGSCAVCAAVRDEIRGGAAVAARLYATDPVADGELARTVMTRLGRRTRPRAWPKLAWPKWAVAAAAVLLVGFAAARTLVHGPFSGRLVESESAQAERAPVPGRVPGYAGPHFVDVTDASGIDDVDHTGLAGNKDWMVEQVGHGAAVFDMDGDGDLDLFVPDGNVLDPAQHLRDTWRLFRNDGGMHFTDVTKGSGLTSDAWACGAVAGDVNGDGLPDLFVACFGKNHLFANKGGGKFEDVTDRAGVAGLESEWSTAAAFADFDGDGHLDLFVSNYADMRRFMSEATGPRGCKWHDMPVACGPTPLEPQQDRLFLNRGDGTFVDATATNLPRARRYSFQCVALDLNGDGAPDVFVAADGQANLLYLNDGHGHFTEEAKVAGVAADGQGKEQACMGVATGDVDGDGLTDLFVTNFSHESNVLYRGRGGHGVPIFADVTAAAGLVEPDALLGWGTSLFDFDCDGALDVMFANGHLYPGVEELVPTTSYEQPLSLYANDGTGRFHEITGSAGDALCVPRVHRGLVVADFDDDGKLDAFVTVLNGRAHLLRNDGVGSGHGIQFVLRRADGHVEAAGAHVTAHVTATGHGSIQGPATGTGDHSLCRDLLLGSSFGSSEDPRLHFGLGGATRVSSVEVRWPFGAAQRFGPLPADGLYELVEGRAEPRRLR